MDWDKLKAFYHVARLGNISKAADVINLSQSATSRQIISLEDRIGRPLFIRTKRGLILTEEGALLFESSEKMLHEAQNAQAKILEVSNEVLGSIKITTTNALASSWLPQYIPGYLKLYPKVNITIIGNDKNLDLRSREADVAIRTYAENQPNLEQLYLTSFHLGLFASHSYLEEHGDLETVEDLDHHRLLTFGDYEIHPYGNINWILEIGAKGYTRKPYLSLNSSQGLYLMAEQGMGIAALSQEFANENSKLLRVLPNIDGPIMDIYYVFPKDISEIKRFRLLGEYLQNQFHIET